MPYTSVTLNVGFYSRLREVNKASSYTVMGDLSPQLSFIYCKILISARW